MEETKQAVQEQISTSLEVEQLDDNLFRSKSLYRPLRARGVFGGQVISQALVSATNTIDPAFSLHSLHVGSPLIGSTNTPIIYNVDLLRKGNTYVVCTVKAIQTGHVIFTMTCSFQKPEPWQPSHQWPMPDVPPPEQCLLEEEWLLQRTEFESAKIHPKLKEYFQQLATDKAKGPIAVKRAKGHDVSPDGTVRYMYWMKAKDIPRYEAPFQKCILSYLSDINFIPTVARTMGLKRTGDGHRSLAMMSTLDHSIYFYDGDFHCGDWLLYVMESPRAGSGRGVVHGRLYTQKGILVAVTSQEGVVRAAIREPEQAKLEPKL
ncbi:hypothetical protein APHAL10511_006518 [Amanita phalloides]|nr:hypothetical protein APHAL10511_006518 [Amanita phalloides]